MTSHDNHLQHNAIYVQQQHDNTMQDLAAEKRAKKKAKASAACKECKRLKLRCDKKFPCSSCQKRGCSTICPDGVLTTGKGSRFVLAGSEALHDQIEILTERVRSLETGLEALHSQYIPDEKHPLLAEELLKIKNNVNLATSSKPAKITVAPLDVVNGVEEESEEEVGGEQGGTLQIDESTGTSTYFGPTARAEYFLLGPNDLGLPNVPTQIDILLASQSFPFTTLLGAQDDLAKKLHTQLPDIYESDRLCEIYHARANWFYDALPDSERYVQTLRDELYHSTKALDLHRLGLFFMILALGHLLDPDRSVYSSAAYESLDLAKACLAIKPVLDYPSIPSLQAMFLMCYYILLGNKKPDACWTIMGIIVKVAQSIGLHRDDFKLTEEEAQERRQLWWEIVSLEGWVALGFGRPPSIRLLTANCKQPAYKPPSEDSGFRMWLHMFGRTCVPVVLEVVLGTKAPVYAAILQTAEKIDKSIVPPMLDSTRSDGLNSDKPSIGLVFQRATVVTARSLTALKLHLGWFTQALSEHPEDLRKSKYYQSVEAVHHNACTLIATLHHITSVDFPMVCRFGYFWSNTFSSAVPLCLLVTRAPSSELAKHSLREIEHCFELFARGNTGQNCVAQSSMYILRRLRDKARSAMQEHTGGGSTLYLQPNSRGKDEDDLEQLGGKTKTVRGTANYRDASAHMEDGSPPMRKLTPPDQTHQVTHPTPAPLTDVSIGFRANPQHHPHVSESNGNSTINLSNHAAAPLPPFQQSVNHHQHSSYEQPQQLHNHTHYHLQDWESQQHGNGNSLPPQTVDYKQITQSGPDYRYIDLGKMIHSDRRSESPEPQSSSSMSTHQVSIPSPTVHRSLNPSQEVPHHYHQDLMAQGHQQYDEPVHTYQNHAYSHQYHNAVEPEYPGAMHQSWQGYDHQQPHPDQQYGTYPSSVPSYHHMETTDRHAYYYEPQPDYIRTPVADNPVYQHQQELWKNMVQQLHK